MKYYLFFFLMFTLLFVAGNLIAFIDGLYYFCDLGFGVCDEDGALKLADLFTSLWIEVIGSLFILGVAMAREKYLENQEQDRK